MGYVIILTCFSIAGKAQLNKADSVRTLRVLLAKEKIDSNRVKILWQLAEQINVYNPDTAILLSQQALFLAKKINYQEGQSRALALLSNTFIKIGNYPRALDLNIQKLKIDEKGNEPSRLASVLMNIGVIYVLQEEYEKALTYYAQSDSVISLYNIKDLKWYIDVNLGDVYNRLNISETAYIYFNRALQIARQIADDNFIGISMTGLGHSYLKLGKIDSSLFSYRTGIAYLQSVKDDETLTEAALGLAKLFKQLKQYDSSKLYAALSYSIAKKDGFLSKELEAAEFLTEHYRLTKDIDSAFIYIHYVKTLNDSVNSRNRIRESQVISSNEQFRQYEIEENNKLAMKERKQRLQLLFIGIFIPGLFLITLFLSRVKINIKVIRFLGIVSLMFLFEYITILLHPVVINITHHTPWIEIMIFVALGAVLVPAHHRLEHWLIQKLLQQRSSREEVATANEEALINIDQMVEIPKPVKNDEISSEIIINEMKSGIVEDPAERSGNEIMNKKVDSSD